MEGDHEHSSSSLGHSEELSVENPVGPPVPELAQATEERPKVLASITGEEARYILEEDGGRSVLLHKVKEGIGEAGAGALVGGAHASSLAGDGEVLAGEAAGPEGGVLPIIAVSPARVLNGPVWFHRGTSARSIESKVRTAIVWLTTNGGVISVTDTSRLPCCQSNASGDSGDVTEVRDSGPSLGEDGTGIGVNLGEADGSPSGTFKSKVKSSDP